MAQEENFRKRRERKPEEGRYTESAGAGENTVVGRNAVLELLKSDRPVDKLYVQKGEREGSIVMLVALAQKKGIPIVETEKNKLDGMASGLKHQGVVASAAQKEYSSLEEILKIAEERGEPPFLVLCDGIDDPEIWERSSVAQRVPACTGWSSPRGEASD